MSSESDLYKPEDLSLIHDDIERAFFNRVEEVQAQLDPATIDPTFWGIKTDAWVQLDPDTQRHIAAYHAVEDEHAMKLAHIEPEVWHEMPLEDRKPLVAPIW